MVKPLSKESEKRMLDGLEKVSSLINSGTHPNSALSQVVSDMQIPAGHIKLMANAINTGTTNAHRQESDNLLSKAAEFPLADSATVLSKIYPDHIPTKQANYNSTVIARDYARSPDWMNQIQSREKAARACNWKMTDKKVKVETDPDKPLKKALAKAANLHKQIEEKRLQLSRVRDQAIKLASDIRIYFKSPSHIPFQEVLTNSVLLFGKQANSILKVAESKSSGVYSSPQDTPVNLTKPPYSLIKLAIELSQSFNHHKSEYESFLKSANEEARTLLRPFGVGPQQGYSVLADLYSPQIKEAGLGGFLSQGFGLFQAGNLARDIARKLPGNVPTSEMDVKDYLALNDPAHESEIRNIQSEALLNDLIANDDVIRGHDPEDVIDAFNEVQQIAPYAANKKPIMRDLIRKRLSGGPQALDQFTVSDALKSQETLKNLQTPSDSNLKLLSETGVLPGKSNDKSVLPKR